MRAIEKRRRKRLCIQVRDGGQGSERSESERGGFRDDEGYARGGYLRDDLGLGSA